MGEREVRREGAVRKEIMSEKGKEGNKKEVTQ